MRQMERRAGKDGVHGDRVADTAFVLCGALAREVNAIIEKHSWQVDLVGLPAVNHVFIDKIASDVEKKLLTLQGQYRKLLVIYADCGTGGGLDAMLSKYGIERVAGVDCYHWYGQEAYFKSLNEQPGTYFLTDFMVRNFQGVIMDSMGLIKHPELRFDYFKNYQRIVYFRQLDELQLSNKAQEIADYLELPLEVQDTGYGYLEQALVDFMNNP